MNILQVNCHYKYGSTGKIMDDLSQYYCSVGDQSIQCYSRGKRVKTPGVYKLAYEPICKLGKLINLFYCSPFEWGSYSTKKLIKLIQQKKPDIVHLHCINAYTLNVYKLFSFLSERNIKTVITLHAETFHTGGCAYALECNQWKNEEGCVSCPQVNGKYFKNRVYRKWKKMRKSISNFEGKNLALISVSPWLMARAEQSTIMKHMNHYVVLNGINTEIFCRQNSECVARECFGINKRYILHVTSGFDDSIKGGQYVEMIAQRLLNDHIEDVDILVVGPHKFESNYSNLHFLGIIRDQQVLANLYSNAEITLLTSKKETFSMICAESLCCGTRVVGFEAGAPETISIPEYSRFCEQGNIDELYKNVIEALNDNSLERDEVSKKSVETYSRETMAKGYRHIYERLLND